MNERATAELQDVVANLTTPALTRLESELRSFPGLGAAERQSVIDGLALALRDRVFGKVARLLILELHAARLTGRLTADDPAGRWDEWIARASQPDYWSSLDGRYPTLRARVDAVTDNTCRATRQLVERFATDRAALTSISRAAPQLTGISLGAGDSHRGGQTVVLLHLGEQRVVYKPRSLRVDTALDVFLRTVLADEPAATRIRVPRVIERDGYGWAEYVEHRYCDGPDELRAFYRNLGHWLAVTRLLGASDLHAENVVAAGPVPVVVDSETLFTPHTRRTPSGYGAAADLAGDLIRSSVLRTGLLPGRGTLLRMRGADISAAGALPDEQPMVEITTIVGAGTDQAGLGRRLVPRPSARNLPSPAPQAGAYWPHLVAGYTEATERLIALDRQGRLEAAFAEFADCQVRVVPRDTAVYAELGTMLWHPSALHDEPAARQRVAGLLARHADNVPGAPSEAAVIAAEIDDLLVGDVPYFSAVAQRGVLTGPGGRAVGPAEDLPKAALARWRDLDPAQDQQIIEYAVISAYRDEPEQPAGRLIPTRSTTTDLDRRRRALAAGIVRTTIDLAIHGDDGTVTWIAPVIGATGPAIEPLALDLYSGLPGVALLLAAYQRETAAGRADEVPGAADLLDRTLLSLRTMERQADLHADTDTDLPTRPDLPGGYVGLGSRIWGWLWLARFGAVGGAEATRRATTLAGRVPAAVAADESHDVLTGMAGAVVPLLHLADTTADPRWRAEAVTIGDRLAAAAILDHDKARWPGLRSDYGLGGFAHGSVGIGWALARLGRATRLDRFTTLADAAFAFQDSLYDPDRGGWRDLRKPDALAENWCYGCDGVGIAAADLATDADPRWRRLLDRAAAAARTTGFGATHTLCHGDLGSVEVLTAALRAGVAPSGVSRQQLDADLISSLEEYGPSCAMTNRLFRPGLLAGTTGVAYHLLRMHPEAALPSLLLPDPGAGAQP